MAQYLSLIQLPHILRKVSQTGRPLQDKDVAVDKRLVKAVVVYVHAGGTRVRYVRQRASPFST